MQICINVKNKDKEQHICIMLFCQLCYICITKPTNKIFNVYVNLKFNHKNMKKEKKLRLI